MRTEPPFAAAVVCTVLCAVTCAAPVEAPAGPEAPRRTAAGDAQPAELAAHVRQLVHDLDADDYHVRQKAQYELIEIGAPVFDAVAEAARSSPSLEVRRRAQHILRRLEHVVSGLRPLETIERPDLAGAVCVTVSRDGRSVYAAASRANAVTVFAREGESGALRHVQTLAGVQNLRGVRAVRISPDGRQAVAAAGGSRALVLYARDPASGRLSQRDLRFARRTPEGLFLHPLDAAWSPDGRFLYALWARTDGLGGITTYEVTPEGLGWLHADTGRDDCFQSKEGGALVLHPDGRTLYVVCPAAGTLVAVGCDPRTGRTGVLQVVRDGENGVSALGKPAGVALDAAGRFVYVSSGRFGGDNTISVFRAGADGRLTLVQQMAHGQPGLDEFLGGQGIVVSADGGRVFAAAARSRRIASFERDAARGGEDRSVGGGLSVLATIPVGGPTSELGPAGLGLSPDGRNLYVALEEDGALAVFQVLSAAGERAATRPRGE